MTKVYDRDEMVDELQRRMDELTALQVRQVTALERIADALERRSTFEAITTPTS